MLMNSVNTPVFYDLWTLYRKKLHLYDLINTMLFDICYCIITLVAGY